VTPSPSPVSQPHTYTPFSGSPPRRGSHTGASAAQRPGARGKTGPHQLRAPDAERCIGVVGSVGGGCDDASRISCGMRPGALGAARMPLLVFRASVGRAARIPFQRGDSGWMDARLPVAHMSAVVCMGAALPLTSIILRCAERLAPKRTPLRGQTRGDMKGRTRPPHGTAVCGLCPPSECTCPTVGGTDELAATTCAAMGCLTRGDVNHALTRQSTPLVCREEFLLAPQPKSSALLKGEGQQRREEGLVS
jgi:hypothetical protein